MRGHLERIWAECARQWEPELIDYLCGCQGLSASQREGGGGGEACEDKGWVKKGTSKVRASSQILYFQVSLK